VRFEYFNALFAAMEHGGEYDMTDIAHFNGGSVRRSAPHPARRW